jgi:hypothetical protein
MASEREWSSALRRGANALVRTVGGASVELQMPVPPVAGDDGEELGLRTPEFQIRLLGPVVLRRSGKSTTVLVPAAALEEMLGINGAAGVRTVMQGVSAVLVGDASFALADVEVAANAGNKALLYRLLLEGEGIEVT